MKGIMMAHKWIVWMMVCCTGLLLLAAPGLAQQSQLSVIKKVQIGGEGGWDYLTVDTVYHRLFISRSSHVQVMDLTTDSLAGDIPGTDGVHGIALAYDLGKGFTSNGRDSSITVFDLKTLKVIKKVQVNGRNPDAILYDEFSHRVFTFNGRSSNASVIDARTDSVVGLVPLSGKPEFCQTDGKGTIFVNIEDKSELTAFDATTLKVKNSLPLAPGEEPSGLALDPANGRLFSVCGNRKMEVVNTSDGKILATVAIGEGVDGAAFDAGTGCAYSSNGGDGTITVVQEKDGKFTVAQTVQTQRGARTIALDPTTHRLYLPTANFGPAPEPTADRPHPRPALIPGTFTIVVVGKK